MLPKCAIFIAKTEKAVNQLIHNANGLKSSMNFGI